MGIVAANSSRATVGRAQHRAPVTCEATLSCAARARTRFAICNAAGELVWLDRDSHAAQWRAELGAAKRAVWLASKVAERAGVERLRLNLVVSAEWLTWGASAVIIGGGKAQQLRDVAHAAGIVLHVAWVRRRDNPAAQYTRSSGELLRREDTIHRIPVVELAAGRVTTAAGAR